MRTESDLRAALLTLESGEPSLQTMRQHLDTRGRRRHTLRSWLPPLAAAVIVVGIAIAATVLVSARHAAPPATTSGVTDPHAIVNVGWVLTSIITEGKPRTPSQQALVIRENGDFQADDRCSSWTGTVQLGHGEATFDGKLRPHSCPAPPNDLPHAAQAEQEQLNATESILAGSVHWSIHDNQLTITKDGVGSLTYRQGASNPPSPSDNQT